MFLEPPSTVCTPDQLRAIESAHELEITTSRHDGSLRPWVPIWVVRVGPEIHVRTWQLRETGWFGHAVRSGRARVRVPGLEAGVVVTQVGSRDADLRTEVDRAYRDKYGGDGGSVGRMIGEEAAASTLRLSPAEVV